LEKKDLKCTVFLRENVVVRMLLRGGDSVKGTFRGKRGANEHASRENGEIEGKRAKKVTAPDIEKGPDHFSGLHKCLGGGEKKIHPR